MIKIIAIDIDGILIKNKFSKVLGDGNYLWLEKMPFLKKCALRAIEVAEWLLKNKIRHEVNRPLINFINALREGMLKEGLNSICVFILTDRDCFGFQNIYKEISSLRLNAEDALQVFKWRKDNDREQRNKIKKMMGTEVKVFFSYSVKPQKSVLYSLAALAEQKNVKSSEVLFVDNNLRLLEAAKTFFGFKTLSQVSDEVEVVLYLIQKTLSRA